ncbi:MAG: hypothetical protein MIO92_05125 [Methanosarcinaceae archaeon]|nr:hypothetical protein [Methanosarcinaceae archaeon]
MNEKESPIIEQIENLCSRAYREFCEVTDFIWKSPNLIKHETEVELKKLDAYFPDNPKAQKERWDYQSRKLNNTFPYMIAVGNLFTVLSLFESYLLLLAINLQSHTGRKVSDEKGQGISRLFNYLKALEFMPSNIPLYQQVQGAIMVRNCFIHASGILSWSRDESKLKKLQESGQYLSPDDRKRRIKSNSPFDELSITTTALGDRMAASNEYAWMVSNYIRDYFSMLCGNVADFIRNK